MYKIQSILQIQIVFDFFEPNIEIINSVSLLLFEQDTYFFMLLRSFDFKLPFFVFFD